MWSSWDLQKAACLERPDVIRFPDCVDQAYGIPAELHFLIDAIDKNQSKPLVGNTSYDILSKCASNLRSFGRRITGILRNQAVNDLRRQIHATCTESDKNLFKYLNKKNGNPSAAVKDPATGEYVFDHKRQHAIMTEQWSKIYNMHKDNPPDWEAFKEKFGHFEKGSKLSVADPPTAEALHRRARANKEEVAVYIMIKPLMMKNISTPIIK